MTPFLQQVARAFYKEHGLGINEYTFVFPNRRSGIFFQKYLAKEAGKPLFSPTVLTINNLFAEMTSYETADRLQLLFRLYRIFAEKSNSSETFDDFVYWGEMLLNDFDDVDKYVADAKKLFANITDLKYIEEQFMYLEPEQVEIIRQFWIHFIPATDSERKENFAKTWEVLYSIYEELRTSLRNENLAYEGMIFREVAEKILNKEAVDISYDKLVFVGFNALTYSERVMLKGLRDMGIADFYWDYQSHFLRDKDNKASFFYRNNIEQFPSRLILESEPAIEPEVEVIGVASAIGQTKTAYKLLENLIEGGNIVNTKYAINTALVLPDENLLIPSLYAIPEDINPINVTMGTSLKTTPVSGLMELIFDMQKTIKWVNGEANFYFRSIEPILTHKYISSFEFPEVSELLFEMKKNNMIFVPESRLAVNPFLALLFKPIADTRAVIEYLLALLEYMQSEFSASDKPVSETEDDRVDGDDAVLLSDVELEFIYHYYLSVNRLKEIIGQYGYTMSLSTFYRLLRKLTEFITIPFHGEPLSGLQIMGVLETRALDFDNLIILSMNEGVFPLKKSAASFIPHSLRKGFGLSTSEHQDAIYAYHFYRMISRAKKLYFVYDTRDTGMQTGEPSRFIYQLKYHYNMPITYRSLVYDISVNQPVSFEIIKTPEVMRKLDKFITGIGASNLSASSVNEYLNCPVRFYLQKVEGLYEEDEISESMETSTFGTIFHAVMEEIYKRFENVPVTSSLLKDVIDNKEALRRLITEQFNKHFINNETVEPLSGYNYLIGEVLLKFVRKVLNEDKTRTPFIYIASEKDMKYSFVINDKLSLNFTASVDRVDEKDGAVRIIDYKTGLGKLDFSSISKLFDKADKDRAKAVMQVFLYSMIYKETERPSKLEPNIYYLRNFFGTDKNTCINVKPSKNDPDSLEEAGIVYDYMIYHDEFKEKLRECLSEMFNPDIPFRQSDAESYCEYCQFKSLCKK